MRRHIARPGHLFALTLLLTVVPSLAHAAGPLAVCQPGIPYRWPDGGTNIPWNPDQGPLGPLSNAQATTLVGLAFDAWDKIPSSSTTYLRGAPLPLNVTADNFLPFFIAPEPDGLSAIIYDDDGAIFDLLFGPGSGVLGFAGIEWIDPVTCDVVEGLAFLNGAAITTSADIQVALDIMVHEFGHYQNLGHSVVNGQIFIGDTTGPTPFDTFPIEGLIAVLGEALETMYPFYFGPAFGFSTPAKDDIVSLSTLYPAPGYFESTGAITGRIVASNRRTRRTGINVIARNLADPYLDAVSAISSDYAATYEPGSPFVGVYTVRGLTPGAQYAIYVDGLLAGSFSTPTGVLPGREEFYNGPNEDNDSTHDPPNAFVPLSVAAGRRLTGIDIVFNRFRPNEPLPFLDDSAFELALPFKFQMCGTAYDELIVNSNGTVSFGAANTGSLESESAFLAGPPQIAGLWDDLDPAAGGKVYFTESPWHFTVTFEGVPKRIDFTTVEGSNTFSITLKRFFNAIEIKYGSLTVLEGLAGVSCGGAITSGFEKPTDLSAKADRFISLLFRPAVYERFTPPDSPNDLAHLELRFTSTTAYSDFWSEKNDRLSKATRISLPFDSIPVSRFTEIGHPHDVDFYRFRAKAGQVIVAEILTSQLDTIMGFFNSRGELLAVDDDGGEDVLSRIVMEIPKDGYYFVAVSTFGDFDFVGQGTGETGRYVLSVAPASAPKKTASPPEP